MSFKSFWKSSGDIGKPNASTEAVTGAGAVKAPAAASPEKDVAGPANKVPPKV